jgi:AraC-like DNA-binding protein
MPSQGDLHEDTADMELINILVIFIIIILPLIIYWLLGYLKLLKHQKNVYLFSSNIETVDLTWLRYFMWGLASMVLAWFAEIVWDNLIVNIIASMIYLISAFYLAYYALQQDEVFSTQEQEAIVLKEIIDESQLISQPKKTLLDENQLEVFKKRLTDLMEAEKPYLDSTLSLSKLAQLMKVSTHELSYVINTSFEDNFFNFINRYRVEQSKKLLVLDEYNHLSMVGIAFEAGFNSKTAFNTAFKKMTGLSPTEFQKSALMEKNNP